MSTKREDAKEWKNVPFETLEHEGQTSKKHEVLEHYFEVWLFILGLAKSKVTGQHLFKKLRYVDCFGGMGAYHNEEDLKDGEYLSEELGSPTGFMRAVQKVRNNPKIKFPAEIEVIVIDKKKKCIKNIEKVIDFYKLDKDITTHLIHGSFDEEINKILDNIQQDKDDSLTLFLLDPFGYSQVRMETIERIMSLHMSEIIINFMYNAISQYGSIPEQARNMDSLFGSPDWRKFIGKHTEEKEIGLVALYKKSCERYARFVFPYRLEFPDKKRTYYHLFHLSNNRVACSRMKDSFASKNGGYLEYRKVTHQYMLTDLQEEHKRRDSCTTCFIKECVLEGGCESCILEVIRKHKQMTYGNLVNNIIADIRLRESGIKKALKELEGDNAIKVTVGDGRKRQGGFNDSDIIEIVS
jgi:three-Cys-motif partner protein